VLLAASLPLQFALAEPLELVLPVVVLSVDMGFLTSLDAPPPASFVLRSMVAPVGAGLDWAKAGPARPRAKRDAIMIFVRM
jgi:hypothetical protein